MLADSWANQERSVAISYNVKLVMDPAILFSAILFFFFCWPVPASGITQQENVQRGSRRGKGSRRAGPGFVYTLARKPINAKPMIKS